MSNGETVIRKTPDSGGGTTAGQAKKFVYLAVVLAFLTALMIFGYLQNLERRYAGQERTVEVLVARRGIAAKTVIQNEHVAKRALPRSTISERAITPDRIDWIVGQTTRWPIQSGEPILWTDLGMEKAGGLSHRIPEGYRTIAIGVDNITSVSGLVRPLDRVDIIGIFGGENAITILQDVSVLSVGRAMDEEGMGGGFGSVNLLVTLEEAQMLSLAQQRARLVLALRNPHEDIISEKIPRTSYSEILNQGKPVAFVTKRKATPPAERGRPIEVIAGGRERR
jgi:pilus assembly protein CpaB